jgi:hypothetical protein
MRGRVLKADIDKDGYQRVTLYKRGGDETAGFTF